MNLGSCFIILTYLSPHVRESGIRNPANFCCWNPESTMVWNPESTALVWNPESRRLESGIQKVGIQNPDAGIRNLDARFNYLCILFNVLEGAVSLSFSFTYSNLGRREMQSLQSRTSKRDIALCKRIHEAPEFRIPACPSCLSLPL